MLEIFEKSIFVDPLTKLPNFFDLIESDVELLFKKHGSVILFDFIGFGKINTIYGNETGDMYLRILSSVISEEISIYNDAKAFRTDGDEFTIVLPETPCASARLVANRIKASFANEINQYDALGIRSLVFDYSGDMHSITKFYNLILQKSYELVDDEEGTRNSKWIEDIIDSFTRRIRETLSNFNDAYVMAMADDISGLPNHRAGKTYLKHLIEESRANEQLFSILFIDGDNLKRYNEISYQAGNKMIRELSDILNSSIRKGDRIFRWLSGDEFLVVLSNVNSDNAVKLAERTRKAVEEATKSWAYPVTISIGVAHYTHEDGDIEEIILKAERANQFAKNLGKNRVVSWNKAYDNGRMKNSICG